MTREFKYRQISDDGSKIVGKVQLNRRVLLTVHLEEHHAVELVAMARRVGRSVGELVLSAIENMLAALPKETKAT